MGTTNKKTLLGTLLAATAALSSTADLPELKNDRFYYPAGFGTSKHRVGKWLSPKHYKKRKKLRRISNASRRINRIKW